MTTTTEERQARFDPYAVTERLTQIADPFWYDNERFWIKDWLARHRSQVHASMQEIARLEPGWSPDNDGAMPFSVGEYWMQRYAALGHDRPSAVRRTVEAFGAAISQVMGEHIEAKAAADPSKETRLDWPNPTEHGWPDSYGMAGVLLNLKYWAENNDMPLADSVDEQSRALSNMTTPADAPSPTYVMWPQFGDSGAWATTGDGKAFLGEVMKYKRARCAPLQVGDEVRVLRSNGGDTTQMVDSTYSVLWLSGDEIMLPHPHGTYRRDGQPCYVFSRHHVALVNVPPVGQPESVPHVGQAEPMHVTSEVEQLRAELAAAKAAHREDITTVARRLKLEARRRGWCSEYEQVIDDLNGELNVQDLDTSRLWFVEWNEVYTLHVHRNVIVEAASEEAAEERAHSIGRASDGSLAHHIMSNETPPLSTDLGDRNYTVSRYSGGDEGNDGEWGVWDQHDSDNYDVEIESRTEPGESD